MTGDQVIEAYLGQLAATLPGPPRARDDIVAELRGGLLDAAEAHRSAGLPPAAAAAAAVGEFGDPCQVAAAFRAELTARHARHLAVTLAATGVPVGLLWVYAVQASHPGLSRAPLWKWAVAPPIPLAMAALGMAVLAALGTAAATGRLTRWLPDHPGAAAASAAIGGYGSAAADIAIFALLAHQLAVAPGGLAPIPVAAAAVASLARLALARRAARRCLAARAALS